MFIYPHVHIFLCEHVGVDQIPFKTPWGVVFKCNNDSSLRKEILKSFQNDTAYKGAIITAASMDDGVSRAEELEAK